MTRRITRVEASERFWKDLEPLRKEAWYGDLRRAIAKFVTDLASGDPVRESGFSNPKLKGIMHTRLPRNLRLFHVYPDSHTLRLCLVADHKVYGFNGKHTGREGKTADTVRRISDTEPLASPCWSSVKWKVPADLLDNPELGEMSVAGLRDVLDDLERESHDWNRLMQIQGVEDISDIPIGDFEGWACDLIKAQDAILDAIETATSLARRSTMQIEDFEVWEMS